MPITAVTYRTVSHFRYPNSQSVSQFACLLAREITKLPRNVTAYDERSVLEEGFVLRRSDKVVRRPAVDMAT